MYFINFLPNVSPEAVDCEQFLFCSRSVSERDTWVYEQRSREHRVVRASCSLALAHKIFEQKIDCLQSTEAKENFSIILL